MIKVELLAPAGDAKKLELAILYGADAVYVSGKDFGLRAKAGNFTDKELKLATEFAHSHGKRIYVTVNIFARNTDFEPLKKHLKFLESIKVDAVIVSDLGVLRLARENTNLEIHISTQANVLNKYTAQTYADLGASRIILARECSLDEIKEIAAHLKGRCEIEVFIHGAMCVSYSGRCLLSSYMDAQRQNTLKGQGDIQDIREANRGACMQPCRFKYALVEEHRPGIYFPIDQDKHGTYILNSRDLCLAGHLQELAAAGVTSFKIEGRTKSEYYVAGAVNTYRHLIDNLSLSIDAKQQNMHNANEKLFEELQKISHRPYTTGFLLGTPQQCYPSAAPNATHEFIAICVAPGTVQQRNAFEIGDTLEILSPNPKTLNKTFTVTKIITQDGEQISRAKKVQEILKINCPFELRSGDILRKKI